MKSRLINICTLGLLMIIVSCSSTKTANKSGTAKGSSNPKINRDNYYDYYSTTAIDPITTNWLRRNEAVPIIIDELNKLGYAIFAYELYELPDSNRIILDVYSREKDIGVVFNTGHSADVKKEQRNKRTFNQDRFITGGVPGKREIYEHLPDNILVLQETWYWYQYIDHFSSSELLNKATIIEILRQDVRAFVKVIEGRN